MPPGRNFFVYAPCMFMEYDKPALSIAQQLAVLQQRGLTIQDMTAAEKFLWQVSYFRFAAYLRPLESDRQTHQFKPGAHIEQAVALYSFDMELRKLLFDAIQRIEIALRSCVIQQFSLAHGPFWFLDATLAIDEMKFAENVATLKRELERTKEDFIKEHTVKYGSMRFPPAWKMLELVSFGCLAQLYRNLADKQAKRNIAKGFNIRQHYTLESWMLAVNVMRNYCAHHARIWNRTMPVMPQMLTRPMAKWITDVPAIANRPYAILCCIAYWLNSIDAQNTFAKDVKKLLRRYPTVDATAMGFPAKGWRKEPLWQ